MHVRDIHDHEPAPLEFEPDAALSQRIREALPDHRPRQGAVHISAETDAAIRELEAEARRAGLM